MKAIARTFAFSILSGFVFFAATSFATAQSQTPAKGAEPATAPGVSQSLGDQATPTTQAPTPQANSYFNQSNTGGCDSMACPPTCQPGCQPGFGAGCRPGFRPGCQTGCQPGYQGYSGGCQSDCGPFGLGIIRRSDRGFDSFISPMTNPVFFEDPRALTEARGIFFHHEVPGALQGGHVQLYALQLRARLSENVSLIATKDGYVTSSNPLVNNGWADLAAGLKFNLLRDVQNQRLLSAGFTFEFPTGEADPLQGNGHGELNLFITGGKKLSCRSHWLSAAGFRFPMHSSEESTSTYWSNHIDYQVTNRLYFLAEANWYHWTKSGKVGPVPGVEGLDVINLGSPAVAGNDIVTAALGAKFKPKGTSEIGVAYEIPLTDRRDIIEGRLTVDAIFRY